MTDFSIPEKIIDKLAQKGHDAYLVGGCVRDFLLGTESDDIDICTSATPEEVKECFSDEKIIETGIKHGTVTLLLNDESFEITTFRTEESYNDGRHPSNVRFVKSLEEDLSRRDFTVNALAMDVSGTIYDYVGGCKDIRKKRLAAVGDPVRRFRAGA